MGAPAALWVCTCFHSWGQGVPVLGEYEMRCCPQSDILFMMHATTHHPPATPPGKSYTICQGRGRLSRTMPSFPAAAVLMPFTDCACKREPPRCRDIRLQTSNIAAPPRMCRGYRGTNPESPPLSPTHPPTHTSTHTHITPSRDVQGLPGHQELCVAADGPAGGLPEALRSGAAAGGARGTPVCSFLLLTLLKPSFRGVV